MGETRSKKVTVTFSESRESLLSPFFPLLLCCTILNF